MIGPVEPWLRRGTCWTTHLPPNSFVLSCTLMYSDPTLLWSLTPRVAVWARTLVHHGDRGTVSLLLAGWITFLEA